MCNKSSARKKGQVHRMVWKCNWALAGPNKNECVKICKEWAYIECLQFSANATHNQHTLVILICGRNAIPETRNYTATINTSLNASTITGSNNNTSVQDMRRHPYTTYMTIDCLTNCNRAYTHDIVHQQRNWACPKECWVLTTPTHQLMTTLSLRHYQMSKDACGNNQGQGT